MTEREQQHVPRRASQELPASSSANPSLSVGHSKVSVAPRCELPWVGEQSRYGGHTDGVLQAGACASDPWGHCLPSLLRPPGRVLFVI